MKFEHKLYHRITHKNGRVGDWVMDGIMSNSEIVKFVDFNMENAERLGKTVEHKIQSRVVCSWYEDDLDKVLKLAEKKEERND